MNKLITVAALIAIATPVAAEPVNLTGMSCSTPTGLGTLTWEFYGDVAIRYFDDGSVSSLPRVGEGAYERYDRDGNWAAIYFFYDVGDGIQVRVLSRPALLAREQNRAAPLEKNVVAFNGACAPIWER